MAAVVRCLQDIEADVDLGLDLVREYVVATALETGADVELILPLIPELDDFAGWYLGRGAFVVAERTPGGEAMGGVGVSPGTGGHCEINRLWVRPEHRRLGLARTLCEASMREALALGFRHMTLDVLTSRPGPIALYRSLGFGDRPLPREYPFEMISLGRAL